MGVGRSCLLDSMLVGAIYITRPERLMTAVYSLGCRSRLQVVNISSNLSSSFYLLEFRICLQCVPVSIIILQWFHCKSSPDLSLVAKYPHSSPDLAKSFLQSTITLRTGIFFSSVSATNFWMFFINVRSRLTLIVFPSPALRPHSPDINPLGAWDLTPFTAS